MRLVRGLAGVLLWLAASLLGLVGALLCVTVIGLPIGIFLVRRAGRLFSTSVRLMLPSKLAHPLKEAKGATEDEAGKATKAAKQVRKKAKRKRSWESRLGL